VQFLCLCLQVLRYVADDRFSTVLGVFIKLHLEDIHQAVERGTRIDRELDLGNLVAETFLEGFQCFFKIRLVMIALVYNIHHWDPVLFGIPLVDFGPHFHPVLRIDHHDGHVADPEAGYEAAYEIVGPGGIQDVDLPIPVFRV
jgi:hypothetical protein